MYSKPRPSSPMRSVDRHLQAVDEHLVGIDRLASHLLDLAHLDEAAIERGVEQAQSFCRLAHLFDRHGTRQDQHLVGDLRRGDPDFRAVDNVAVAAAFGLGLELRGFEAGIGFGHGEAGFFLAGGDRRQHAALLFVGAVNHDRVEPENVHVHGGRAGQSGAGGRDRFHDDRSFGDTEARAAIGFRHADAEPAGIGDGTPKFLGKLTVAVALEPILIVKACADPCDGLTQRPL